MFRNDKFSRVLRLYWIEITVMQWVVCLWLQGGTPAPLTSYTPPPSATPQTQTSVQIQTVVDGQSQTSMPVRIPSKETDRRNSKSNRSSTRSKEEAKLESIEEGTEPDPRMRRVKSIPETRDESTVTVGDIASQTETVRKVSSASKNVDDLCVCPTGVCPKKKPKAPPPCGECTPGQLCTSTKKPQGKEYRSTADAILAPVMKVLPGNERGFSPPVRDGKSKVVASESSMSACCICGNPVTPVASKKSTSIPMPKNAFSKNKLMLSSEASDDSFLCCACKGLSNSTPKNTSPGIRSERSVESGRGSSRGKPASETIESSCNREICCPCSDGKEIHVLTKPLLPELEITKSKVKPETKDVCCVAKISRDKVGKTESRRRKDKESIKSISSSVSHNGCGQMASSSSTHTDKGPGSSVSSDSNFCCSSMGQVVDMTKIKKRKESKCACDGKDGKDKKEKCDCGEDTKVIDPEQAKHSEHASCVCPPKLFEKP